MNPFNKNMAGKLDFCPLGITQISIKMRENSMIICDFFVDDDNLSSLRG